mmetsp:Transcript_12440/g.28791  ORF Transcript_12440/g.28791 Transcript_12440/m.28791 type:complete len:127 (+) Transcript_12440:192-572(+)
MSYLTELYKMSRSHGQKAEMIPPSMQSILLYEEIFQQHVHHEKHISSQEEISWVSEDEEEKEEEEPPRQNHPISEGTPAKALPVVGAPSTEREMFHSSAPRAPPSAQIHNNQEHDYSQTRKRSRQP